MHTPRRFAWVVVGCLLTTAAFAQSTRDRLDSIEARLERLERAVYNNDSLTNMLRKINDLEAENQQLRNEIETLQFQAKRNADRQRELYMDLDQRLQALQAGGVAAGSIGGAAAAGGAVAGGTATSPDGAVQTDQEAYQAAFSLLKEGRYSEAATGFSTFLASYPESSLRSNAQYWLAETNYVSQDFEKALQGFQQITQTDPTSTKIADAWLKIGYCNYELKRWNDARQALQVVTSRFAGTTAAQLAQQRLDMMAAEGR